MLANHHNFPAVSQQLVKEDYAIYFSTDIGQTVAALIGLGVVMGGVENLVRRNLVNYLLTIIIILAIIAAIILVVEFWEWILILVLIGVVIFIIRGNILELRR